jgi:secondary thiamine-phosphate synthase enzyme
MWMHADRVTVQTAGRGTYDLTPALQAAVADSTAVEGVVTAFLHHTSASLIITENADPDVRLDLETWFAAMVEDGDRRFLHDAEGPDDMASHIRSVLTQSSVTIPIRHGRADLGQWQGLYLWEHRTAPHARRVTFSIVGM